ncbi:LysE family translocator [Streptomyces sp. TR06-5]|uniref:LysE family translocator n=1 Tax=unclassified Streptomyces TaxID=2593676 RepID=UPI0039A354D1
MVTTGALLGISAVALGLVLTPGPNMIYLVSRSVMQGRRAGLVSLLGVATGFLFWLGAAVAGITTLLTLVPGAYLGVKLAGAAYLAYLAWKTLRPGGASVFDPEPMPVDRPRRLFTMGLVTNLLNPKIAVLYLSVLPQFVDPDRGSIAAQSLVLGLAQICIAVTVNALIATTAGSLSAFLRRRPHRLRVQRRIMSTVLAGVSVHVAAS